MLRLRAPAKLNLYLRVLGRRADGYHELETFFERLDLADELTLTPQARGIDVTCDDPALDCGPSNLITKAASLLQQTFQVTGGAAIHLTKRIPIAAGLGGGSSDAAAVLRGLNRLWRLGLSSEQLREMGAGLGSDVPFFLFKEAVFAIGRGRGERCEPLAGLTPTLWHVLVVPPERLSTKEIYDGFDRRERVLTAPASSLSMCLHALRNGSLSELAKGLLNDLEPEAIRRCPVITEIRTRLRTSGCPGALVSGSGSAVFGLCEDAEHARRVAATLSSSAPAEWRLHLVRTDSEGDDDAL
ncbi:MAG: 4-(cytidine 5'-diphospho)-2-C-methyl-D-erythritol kinase [Candidatus Omnitrophica bacterium]|nr:4-(cytidine 5'-diphospho)-2-C-methyl-D-erythritol kinase [Candidatus Omnitrophota bacterium]